MLYRILRVTGDYSSRQLSATTADADLYLEAHFNASPDRSVTYPAGLYVERPGCEPSRELAREYAAYVAERCPVDGEHSRAIGLAYGDRGRGNIAHVSCPAIIMEPGFVSHPGFAAWSQSAAGVHVLAEAIVHVVRGALPGGGVVALSVGHLGKEGGVDRGAPVFGGGWEGDLALQVVDLAHELLGAIVRRPAEPDGAS